MTSRILVTGGMGFIGSHVCQKLVNSGENVAIIDNVSQDTVEFLKKIRMPHIPDEKIKFISGDITDFAFVFDVLKKTRIKRIIHLAAVTFIPTAIQEPSLTFHLNTMGSFNLLEAFRILNLEKFVYISTSSVYGDFEYSPVDENHPLKPKDIYGATKAAAEIITNSYNKTYGAPTTIVRTSSVYGPGDMEKRVVKSFIENALLGKPMQLQGGGTQRRDFSYVKDVAEGIILALNSGGGKGETFNITGGKDYSIKEMAQFVQKYIPNTELQETEARGMDIKRGQLDISKAKNLLNYNPKYDLETGIKEYIGWMVNTYFPASDLKPINKPLI